MNSGQSLTKTVKIIILLLKCTKSWGELFVLFKSKLISHSRLSNETRLIEGEFDWKRLLVRDVLDDEFEPNPKCVLSEWHWQWHIIWQVHLLFNLLLFTMGDEHRDESSDFLSSASNSSIRDSIIFVSKSSLGSSIKFVSLFSIFCIFSSKNVFSSRNSIGLFL